MKSRVVIGTRRSRLALIQTEIVAEALRAAFPGLVVERREIMTEGDRDGRDRPAVGDCPVMQFEQPGIFTRAIETRLLAGEIDLAVHSFKDLPTELAKGLKVAATPKRADPRDVLVYRRGTGIPACPSMVRQECLTYQLLSKGATVGTSSPRRSAQLLAIRPDLVIKDLRGNVDTRLAKLARGDYDAIVVAKAALDRLGTVPPSGTAPSSHIEVLDPAVVLPAPAQGALAVECREGDVEVETLAGAINDAATFVAASAERELLARLGGGCRLALGALAEVAGETLRLRAVVMSEDGARAARADARGRVDDPRRVVEDCRRQLIAAGAAELLG